MMEPLSRRSYFEVAGIYRIYHNDKSYIGSSVNLYKRINAHINELIKGKSSNLKLQNYINKYGADAMQIEVLEVMPSPSRSDLSDRETYFINLYDSVKHGFNCLSLAYSPLGSKWTDSQKNKLKIVAASNALKYREGLLKNLDKARQSKKLNGCKKPRPHAPISEGTRQKMRASAIRRGANTGKPVAQYSIDGIYIKTFKSSHEAERETCIAQQNIGKCCLGKRPSAGGFKWAFSSI